MARELTNEELNALLLDILSSKRVLINTFLNDTFTMLYDFGFRINEVLELERWSTYDSTYLRCHTSKGSNPRLVPRNEVPQLFYNSILHNTDYYLRSSYATVERVFQSSFPGKYILIGTKPTGTHLFRHNYIKKLSDQGYTAQQIKDDTGILTNTVVFSYVNSEPTIIPY